MKKRSRKTLVRLLDQKASSDARKRHLYTHTNELCQFCYLRFSRVQTATQCFHILSRKSYSTRWLPENCFWSCASCNIRYEQDADFVSRVIDWYKEKFGAKQWDWLSVSYHTPIPIKDWEL